MAASLPSCFLYHRQHCLTLGFFVLIFVFCLCLFCIAGMSFCSSFVCVFCVLFDLYSMFV